MGDVWPVPGGGEAASLLGTSPEQRKRSIPSSIRCPEASGWLRFPPLWETSGLSLAAVGLRLSWGRLRTSENAAYRRALALWKLPPASGFSFYGKRLACPWWQWVWGTSPEQRKRSMPSGVRPPEASGRLRFPPLWETSVWCVLCVVCGVVCKLWDVV